MPFTFILTQAKQYIHYFCILHLNYVYANTVYLKYTCEYTVNAINKYLTFLIAKNAADYNCFETEYPYLPIHLFIS